jgi:hypothetical protein
MNMMRKVALTLAAAAFSVGALGITAPAAHAFDTNWPCQGCAKPTPRP